MRPVNYPVGTPGQGSTVIERAGQPTVGVINAQGNTFMRGELDNPFRRVREEVKKMAPVAPVILLDFHAEATSEKIAMARMLDGHVSVVVGTHTHVQTADEFIFPGGTAFLCDAGFTGHDCSLRTCENPDTLRPMSTPSSASAWVYGAVSLQSKWSESQLADAEARRTTAISIQSAGGLQGGRSWPRAFSLFTPASPRFTPAPLMVVRGS